MYSSKVIHIQKKLLRIKIVSNILEYTKKSGHGPQRTPEQAYLPATIT